MEKIIDTIGIVVVVFFAFAFFFGSVAIEIASDIMRWIDENRSR